MNKIKALDRKPSDNENLKTWNQWKQDVLTESMQEFKKRHPWFKFKKQDIFINLGKKTKTPKTLYLGKYNDSQEAIKNLDQFVIKKTTGHSSKEVLVLQKKEDGFICSITKNFHTKETITEWAEGSEIIIEESLSTIEETIPIDFKCYLINGKVEFILLINRNNHTPTINLFNAKNLEQIKITEFFSAPPNIWLEGSPTVSMNMKTRLNLAKKQAEEIGSELLNCGKILVSLDMYVKNSPDGFTTYLGEITPRPGAIHSNWIRKKFISELFLNLE